MTYSAERKRQVTAEGWLPAHDDEHRHGELAAAAACYAASAYDRQAVKEPRFDHVFGFKSFIGAIWQWDEEWWKPKDTRRDLERAGALILAEIERIDRTASTKEPVS